MSFRRAEMLGQRESVGGCLAVSRGELGEPTRAVTKNTARGRSGAHQKASTWLARMIKGRRKRTGRGEAGTGEAAGRGEKGGDGR
eukprot:4124461-Pleurochrysis_carterae.AAC.1